MTWGIFSRKRDASDASDAFFRTTLRKFMGTADENSGGKRRNGEKAKREKTKEEKELEHECLESAKRGTNDTNAPILDFGLKHTAVQEKRI
jgi:hypothetical protein